MDPLLDPQTPVPAFAEANALQRHCLPGRQYDPRDLNGQPLADRAAFDSLMQEGAKMAQARHVWRFQSARTQRQREVADGFAARIDPNTLERLRREQTLHQRWLREVQAASDAGNRNPQAMRELQQRAPKVMITAAHRIPQALDELRHNETVLQLQDARLKAQEQAYTDKLIALYEQAFGRLAGIPPARLTLAGITEFERYRAFNIQGCSERGRLSESARNRGDGVRRLYEPLLQSVITATRSEGLAAMARAKTSAELNHQMAGLYPTPLMQQAADALPELTSRYQARRATLLAEEARAREAERQRALAEEAARLAALKRENLDKAARNLAPSLGDVAKLLTTFTIENTIAHGDLKRVERTGDVTFQNAGRFSFFSSIVDHNQVEVSGLSCTPANGLQRCSFVGNMRFTDLQDGVALRTYQGPTTSYTATFRWTENGLDSPDLKRSVGPIGYPSARSSSTKDPWDAHWSREEWRRKEAEDFYVRQRTDPEFRRATGGIGGRGY